MAPRKGTESLLELCTSSITLGNSIAVHMLDYLSVVKDPPHGFNRLAVVCSIDSKRSSRVLQTENCVRNPVDLLSCLQVARSSSGL